MIKLVCISKLTKHRYRLIGLHAEENRGYRGNLNDIG